MKSSWLVVFLAGDLHTVVKDRAKSAEKEGGGGAQKSVAGGDTYM